MEDEVLLVSIGRETSRIPDAKRASLAPARSRSAEWRAWIECPTTPSTASRTALPEHTDDGCRHEAVVRRLRNQLPPLLGRTQGDYGLEAKVDLEAVMPADWCRETSQKVIHARIWPRPAAGTLEMTTWPFGTPASFTLAVGDE
jgi:hypothetical protein